jgi:hypothetical protein
VQNALVINGQSDARTTFNAAPLLEPKGQLVLRYEPDNKTLFIQASSFKEDCAKRQENYNEILKDLKIRGIFKGRVVRRLGTGMKVASAPVYVLEFDCSQSDFLSVGDLPIKEDNDAGGEHQLPDKLESV